MSGEPTLYEVLGIAPTATRMEIRTAYRVLAKQLHPDMGGSSREFDAVTEAYDVLSDPARRARYDESLRPVGPGVTFDPLPPSYEPPVADREEASGDEYPDLHQGWRGWPYPRPGWRPYTIVLAAAIAAGLFYIVSAVDNVPDYSTNTFETSQLSCSVVQNVAISAAYASKVVGRGNREWWPRITVRNGSSLDLIVEVDSSGQARKPDGKFTPTSAWTLDTIRIPAGGTDTEDSVPDHSQPLVAPPGSTFTQASLGTVYGGDSTRGYLPPNGCPVPVIRG